MELVEIPNEQYEIAKTLFESFGNVGPLMIANDKKSLIFGIDKSTNRLDRELGKKTYRIRIEALN